jgi:hypothetical protein
VRRRRGRHGHGFDGFRDLGLNDAVRRVERVSFARYATNRAVSTCLSAARQSLRRYAIFAACSRFDTVPRYPDAAIPSCPILHSQPGGRRATATEQRKLR